MSSTDWVILVFFGLPGLVFLLDLGGINERIAAPYRTPRPPLRLMYLPVTMRAVGGISVFMGVVLVFFYR